MVVRDRLLSLVYRSLSLIGLCVCFYFLQANFSGDFGLLNLYFPTLAGYLYIGCFALLIIFNGIDLFHKGRNGIAAGLWMPFGLGVVFIAFCTLIFYLTYMMPFRHAEYSINEFIMYLIMPMIYVLDWVFFEEKGTVKYIIIPFWIFFVAVYFLFILVRPYIWGNDRTPNGTFYPYSFLDFDRWGIGLVWTYLAIALIAIIFIAALTVLLNDLVAGKFKRRLPKQD